MYLVKGKLYMDNDKILKEILDYIWDHITDKNRSLIDLLLECKVKIEEESYWNDYKTYTDLIVKIMVPKRLYDTVNIYKEIIRSILQEIIPLEDNYVEINVEFFESYERQNKLIWTRSKIYFQDIVSKIIIEINNTKDLIWISNPYLTNDDIMSALNNKARQGASIRVIMLNNDYNNRDYSLFETYRIRSWGNSNSNNLHRKFCVIDFNILISGGMNFSKNAVGSWEQIDISYGKSNEIKEYITLFKEQVIHYIDSLNN